MRQPLDTCMGSLSDSTFVIPSVSLRRTTGLLSKTLSSSGRTISVRVNIHGCRVSIDDFHCCDPIPRVGYSGGICLAHLALVHIVTDMARPRAFNLIPDTFPSDTREAWLLPQSREGRSTSKAPTEQNINGSIYPHFHTSYSLSIINDYQSVLKPLEVVQVLN